MNKYILISFLSVGFIFGAVLHASAQVLPVLTAELSSSTPTSKSIGTFDGLVDVSKITLTATGGDVYLSGFYMATDVAGGLINFSELQVHNSTPTLLGTYPAQSATPNLIELSDSIKISSGSYETYLIQGNLSGSATGNVRVGFSGFTYTTSEVPTLINVPIYGNIMTLPGATPPTPTPTSTPTPTPTPTSTPTPTPTVIVTPSSLGFTNLTALSLKEGDTVSATGSSDPDIYIANSWGYKRLFLNPIIFGFYGHLGGFTNVKAIIPTTRDMLVTSGLFRNCETNDSKVYGVEVTGEDTGTLHWINTSGDQAVLDDPDFFKKVFCINNNEFSWYTQGSVYTSVNQVPSYSR